MSGAVEKMPQIVLAGESLSEVRHNMRTPINHILGYGEMLMEDAEDQGKQEFLPDLRRILEDGKLALAVINGALTPATNEVFEPQIRDMSDGLLSPVTQILEIIQRIEPALVSGDVVKIRTAAQKLLIMTAELLEPAPAAHHEAPPKPPEPEILVVPIPIELKTPPV